jgi:DNA-binding transcriptional ArsR family regulator
LLTLSKAEMSIANASQHLQRLKRARLVTSEREGLYARYRLADPAVAGLWLELRQVAGRRGDQPGSGRQSLCGRLD